MNYRDPVCNRAIGAFDKELKKAVQDGLRLKALRDSGLLTPQEEERVKARYKGVCRRRLEQAMEELYRPENG